MPNDDSPRPPDDLFPGAVHRGNGHVTFALYAPGKRSVHLIGDFNDWDRSADPLTLVPEGLWWTEKYLEPGEYRYLFVVDGEMVIGDPYARLLAEGAEHDPPRAIVQVGNAPYRWRHDDWARPAFNELVVYELHTGDFSPEGNFQGVIDRLDYLRDLGINAIELMPVFEFSGEEAGWGYNPAYFLAVEKSYGTADKFRELIDEAHGRGIAIILDVVVAHTAHRHSFNQMYPYHESPWYGEGLGERNQFGFPTLDHAKGPAQDFMRDVLTYWLREFHVDGYRYDYLLGVGVRGDLGVPHLVRTARAIRPDVYQIGEWSPENPMEVNETGIDGAWHVGGSYALKALLREGECMGFDWDDFERVTSILNPWFQSYERAAQMVNFLESHDEMRVMREIEAAGFDEDAARRKSALGAAILFTMPGEPMLYHGQEWGEATERTLHKRNPIHWQTLETPGGRELFETYRKLCWLRREHPGLRSEGFEMDRLYPEQKSIVYHRWNDEGDEIVVAANFSPSPQAIEIPFPRGGQWREALGDRTVEVDGNYVLELEPSSAAIFARG